MFRGRFEDAKVLVIADQTSQDDMFSGRALTGLGGQKLQNFLSAMGADSSYAILRSIPVDTMDLSVEKRIAIANDERVSAARLKIIQKIIAEGNTKTILAVGPVAQSIVEGIEFDAKVVTMDAADQNGSEIESWQAALKKLGARGKYNGEFEAIPRGDLPAYTRWWMGTSGDRAARGYVLKGGKKVYSGDYYQVFAPTSVTKARAGNMNSAELDSVKSFEKSGI